MLLATAGFILSVIALLVACFAPRFQDAQVKSQIRILEDELNKMWASLESEIRKRGQASWRDKSRRTESSQGAAGLNPPANGVVNASEERARQLLIFDRGGHNAPLQS